MPVQEKKLQPSKDRSAVTVRVSGTLTAPELEELIHELALMRAQMQPAVPDTRAAAVAANCAMLEEDRPSITAAVRMDGSLRISMRNRGIGWTAAIVDRQTAHALGKYMCTATPEFDTLNLIEHSAPQQH